MSRPDTNDPTERFLTDVAEIRLAAAGRDAALLRLGGAMMPLGVVLGIVGYAMSNTTDSALDQRDALVVALIGVSVSVVGVGLFLRYSLGAFLRFWMARMIHQQAVVAPRSTPGVVVERGVDPEVDGERDRRGDGVPSSPT